MTPLLRKEIAEKLLTWLKENKISNCNKTYEVLKQCAEEISEPLYDIWKGYDLLRIMGRIELNNPNGKHGFTVLDFTPLSVVVIKSEEYQNKVKKDMLVHILKTLKRRYSYVWDECMEELK